MTTTAPAAARNGHAPAPQARPHPASAWARGFLSAAAVFAEPSRWINVESMDTASPADVLRVAKQADPRLGKLCVSFASMSDHAGAGQVDAALGGTHRNPVDLIGHVADTLASRAVPDSESARGGRQGMLAEHMAQVLYRLDAQLAERPERDPSLIITRDLPPAALTYEDEASLGVILRRVQPVRLVAVNVDQLSDGHALRSFPVLFRRGQHSLALLGPVNDTYINPAAASVVRSARPVYRKDVCADLTSVLQRARLFRREEVAKATDDLAELTRVREELREWPAKRPEPPQETRGPAIDPPANWRERSRLALSVLSDFSALTNTILCAPSDTAPLSDKVLVRSALISPAEESAETCWGDAGKRFAGKLAARRDDLLDALRPFVRALVRCLEYHTERSLEKLLEAVWKQEAPVP